MQLKLVVLLASLTTALAVASKEVTSPIADGMSLRLEANLLQQIEVRAKSLGPGFCEVRVTFLEQEVAVAAPPLTWSSWKKVGPGVAGGTRTLGFTPKCDTGALGEVRYSSPD